MDNPWKQIDINVYEKHMSLDNVYQLQTLNCIVKEQLYTYGVRSVMILGVASGNGLEHVDVQKLDKVYGVDVNPHFLRICADRYPTLEGIFEPICTDLLSCGLQLPCAELLIADLLVEYIGYKSFQWTICLVKPRYVSCVIQINTGDSFVSESPYVHEFDSLESVHHQLEESELIKCMLDIGYRFILSKDSRLPNGKKLTRLDFSLI